MRKINDENYDEFKKFKEAILVIGRDSCPHCRAYKPLIGKISEDFLEGGSDIGFGEVDLEDKVSKNNIKRDYLDYHRNNLVNIPATVFYINGKIIDSFEGEQDENFVLRRLNKHFNTGL